jgi:hypothetical protein
VLQRKSSGEQKGLFKLLKVEAMCCTVLKTKCSYSHLPPRRVSADIRDKTYPLPFYMGEWSKSTLEQLTLYFFVSG